MIDLLCMTNNCENTNNNLTLLIYKQLSNTLELLRN